MTSDTVELVWEDPPKRTERVNYQQVYDQLRENHRQWARYPGTQSAASQWCQSHPEFEYRSVVVDGERRVWMRHVG